MADIAALEKYACAACGAQAVWNPSKQLLVCPFCGTSTPFTVDPASGALVEHDLARALRELPDESRGWLADRRTVQCQSCKAISLFEPGRVAQNCEFCGSPELVDYEEIKSPIRPQSLLPFKVAETTVREQIRRWMKRYAIDPDATEKTLDWKAFLGSAPKRPFDPARYFRWRKYWDYSGGIATDLFVHLVSWYHHALDLKAPHTVLASGA